MPGCAGTGAAPSVRPCVPTSSRSGSAFLLRTAEWAARSPPQSPKIPSFAIDEDHGDVLIDFSSPTGLQASLDRAVAGGTPILVGTTGLDDFAGRRIAAAAKDIAVLQAANTSLGVALLSDLVERAARVLGTDWDIEILEMHHRLKADAPSGTALALGEAAARGRETKIEAERGRDGTGLKREEGAIGFASLRGGTVAGEHDVIFAGPEERLILSHRAENRQIFARGALAAARFLRWKAGGPLHDARRHRSLVKQEQVFEFFRRLAEENPSPTTELEYRNPYTLLVAVVLSAQATDAGVNIATRPLFERVQHAGADGRARRGAGARCTSRPSACSTPRPRTSSPCREALIRDHGSQVPSTREELEKLPGVGRKTANVVLNTAFHQETFAVDTHIFRVCNRTGLAPGKDPLRVELKLEKVVPQPFRLHAHHWLILHGRYVCKARKPECWRCPVIDLCRYEPKTPPPGTKPSASRSANPGSSAARTAKAPTLRRRSADRSRSRPTRLP